MARDTIFAKVAVESRSFLAGLKSMRSGRHSSTTGRLLEGAFGAAALALASSPALAQEDIPPWLAAHVGTGSGEIARPVLERARALYQRKVSEGAVRNACYFAMDATLPNNSSDGSLARRFYEICEDRQVFHAIPAGHGGGRDLHGLADFSNGRQCAKNFGNAEDSFLTMGGAYVTAETKASFKGYYRGAGGQDQVLVRTFVQFDGEGETANARQRAIGGHAAVTMKGVCLRHDPESPYANENGYVPFGTPVDYTGGRSDGCTSWSPSDATRIAAMVKDDPTTLYIYPDARDVEAVAHARRGASGTYWNAYCLKQIGAPKYWPAHVVEPLLAEYRRLHPAPPPRPAPICGER